VSSTALTIIIFLAAIGLSWALVLLGRALWMVDPAAPVVTVGGGYSPLLTWLRYRRLPRLIWQPGVWQRVRAGLLLAGELGAVVLWAGWFGQVYFNLDPHFVPWGNEFGISIQSHYVWTLLGRCGACVFWNGLTNGGAPAFVDLHGAPLHPLVVLATLIWGPVGGAKLTVAACLALAGLAQWWLARTLRLGLLARLWSAGMAVVAGNVAGRMERGLVPLALSTAMAALVIAACLHLALGGRRRAAVALGTLLALFALSGQGYLQIGFALSVLPALAVLLIQRRLRLAPVWKEFALAGGLAILLSAVLWLPVAHFWPNLGKDTDPTFQSAQPLGATALNLVINDANFYYDSTLGKQPYPYLYIDYIGWVPVVLALVSVWWLARAGYRRRLLFFLSAILLVYLAASGISLRALGLLLPQLAGWVRNPPPIAGLAVPLILSLSAVGLDGLWRSRWPALELRLPARLSAPIPFKLDARLLLLAPLAWSLLSAYDFDQSWMLLYRLPPDQPPAVAALRALVPPGQTQWVQTPWADNRWLTTALDAGLKLAYAFRPWHWQQRDYPLAFAEASHETPLASQPAPVPALGGLNFFVRPDQQYAAVTTPAGLVPCSSTAAGGDVDVTCATTQPGQLVVQEHAWTGWLVQVDGRPANLLPSPQWLAVAAPAGQHTYAFRYRPWDAPLGLALSLAGLVLALVAWRRAAH